MLNQFKKWLQGRYGSDQLGIALLITAFVFSIISGLCRSTILSLITLVIIVACYYRMLSKNHYARQQENFKFIRFYQAIRQKLLQKYKVLKGLKQYKYYKCPNCHQKLRVPRGKGNLCITCPKCKHELHKRT